MFELMYLCLKHTVIFGVQSSPTQHQQQMPELKCFVLGIPPFLQLFWYTS